MEPWRAKALADSERWAEDLRRQAARDQKVSALVFGLTVAGGLTLGRWIVRRWG